MEKLTGIIEYKNGSLPFFMNDYVFDFTPLEIHPMQHLLPGETIKTTEGFVTGWVHSGNFIAVYRDKSSLELMQLHRFIHICI